MKRLVLATIALLLAVAAAPSARADEIDDAVKMFTADDGLTAAEKIPALKAFIEARQNDPKVLPLVSLLGVFAEEAGDKETDKWGTVIFDRLRDKIDAAADAQKSVPSAELAESRDKGDTPVEDPEMKEMLERLKQPPPTEEEMEREMAKLPPLPPLPVPKIKIEKNAINDKLINSATPRSAVINVREKMRLFIGEMDEEDEKKFVPIRKKR